MFFALKVEASAVFRDLSKQITRRLLVPRFGFPTSFRFPGVNEEGSWEWTCCVLGPGPAFDQHLREYLARLAYRPDWVILAGFSGGLGPRAKVGTAFEIREVWQNSPDTGAGTSNIPTHWNGTSPLGCASLATTFHSPGPLSKPEDKAIAFRNTSCDLVDMESCFFAKTFASMGISHSILRSVSDGPNEILPKQAINWINEFGGLRAGQLAWDLVCAPWLIRDLMLLARGSSKAGKSLGKLVLQALQVLFSS